MRMPMREWKADVSFHKESAHTCELQALLSAHTQQINTRPQIPGRASKSKYKITRSSARRVEMKLCERLNVLCARRWADQSGRLL
jgi:hypothetical protein